MNATQSQRWYASKMAGRSQGLIIDEVTGANIAVSYDPKHAHLIAAAPELFLALMNMTEKCVRLVNSGDAGSWNPEKESEVVEARAAIAQAKGES